MILQSYLYFPWECRYFEGDISSGHVMPQPYFWEQRQNQKCHLFQQTAVTTTITIK